VPLADAEPLALVPVPAAPSLDSLQKEIATLKRKRRAYYHAQYKTNQRLRGTIATLRAENKFMKRGSMNREGSSVLMALRDKPNSQFSISNHLAIALRRAIGHYGAGHAATPSLAPPTRSPTPSKSF
jgi:hypothetical protein